MSSTKFTALTFDWLHQVNRDDALKPIDIRVCLQLTKHFNEEEGGCAWPSYKKIGEPIGVPEPTVIRSVKRVHEHGHLRIEWGKPGRGHPNQYWMILKPSPVEVLDGGKPPPVEVSESEKTSIPDEKTSIPDEKTSIAMEENHLNNHPKNHRIESISPEISLTADKLPAKKQENNRQPPS
jgi:hypothetical protein